MNRNGESTNSAAAFEAPEPGRRALPEPAIADPWAVFEELGIEVLSIHDADGTFLWVSGNAPGLLGFQPHELVGRGAYEMIHRDDIERVSREHRSHDGSDSSICYRHLSRTGDYVWVETSARARVDASGQPSLLMASTRKLSPERAAQLEGSRSRDDADLRELRHRVNNSLQVIASMLWLRAGRARSEDTRRVLAGLRARVLTLASFNTALDETGRVRARGCLEALTDQLQRVYPSGGRVTIELRVEPGMTFASESAMSIGLIAVELISNALVHAYPSPRTGRIRVLARHVDGVPVLEIIDDGVGFDPLRVPTDTLGLSVARRLAEQFTGGLQLESLTGTRAWLWLSKPASH